MQINYNLDTKSFLLVYDLKFVGPLEFELVAPMPEQLTQETKMFSTNNLILQKSITCTDQF